MSQVRNIISRALLGSKKIIFFDSHVAGSCGLLMEKIFSSHRNIFMPEIEDKVHEELVISLYGMKFWEQLQLTEVLKIIRTN